MSTGRQDIVDVIVGFVRRRFPAEANARGATRLLEGNSIDSLGLIELMTFLTDTFNIEISDEDFSAENFETIDSVAGLVESKMPMVKDTAGT